jgi:glutamine phosphoribosylpyrophosphate amidotransferase
MYKRKQELVNLQNKVNQLYDIVKQLGEYIGWEGIENISLSNLEENKSPESNYHHDKNIGNLSNVESVRDRILSNHQNNSNSHKDILMDDDAISAELSDYTQVENNISCEEQVYRLTTQLTAAYHRIATLEDQLLATRNQLEVRHNGFYHVQ